MKYIKLFEEYINEALSIGQIEKVAKRVYPKIVKDLGGSAKPVEVHPNIWDRIGAVGVEDLKKRAG